MRVTEVSRRTDITVVGLCVELERAVGAAFRNDAAHSAVVAGPAGVLRGCRGKLTPWTVVAIAAGTSGSCVAIA
jgi:predicted amidohydrolase